MDGRDETSPPAPFGIGVALALTGGVTASLCLPVFLPWPWLVPLLALGLAGWWRTRALRPLMAALTGFALCGLHGSYALAQQLPSAHERTDFAIVGRVVQLPEHGDGRSQFLFRVDRGTGPPFLHGRLLRLSWYDGWDGVDRRRFDIAPGSRWRFTARLRAPRGLRNPGWFDSEKHALARRLSAIGYVRDAEPVERLSPPAGMDAWRDGMAGRIDAVVSNASARYVRALAVGDTRGLDDRDWEILRATGLTHLIAISGFHVGMVAGFFALLAAGLWRLLPEFGRYVPRPQAAALTALAGALFYAAVAGWALPTVRTVLMIAVVVAARLWRRPLRVSDSLALAAVAVLMVDPLSVLAAGFWLSFAGVAWLVWCLPDARGQPLLRGFLSAQWVATLGLLPLTAVLFGQASLAGPLANLVAIPWWSLVVIPLALLGTGLEALQIGAGAWAWRLAAGCFDLSWPLFDWLAGGRFALWWLPEARWFALPLALCSAFWLLMPRGVPGKTLAALLWLPLLWPDRDLPRRGEVELVMLDVGQGLSVLVRTRRHSLLYDMGPAVPDGYDAGERVVVPALQALGVRQLAALVVSHGDADHAGGLAAVRRRYGAVPTFAPHGSGVAAAAPCLAGHGWEVDGVRFRFLHPSLHFPYLGNEASCVLRVEGVHGAALLTGDIGEVIERGLLREDRGAVRAEVVTAGHHGSAGSSDPHFVAATGAAVVMMATGYGNRFGFPREQVLRRWERAGARILDTAPGGALRVRIGQAGVSAEPRRHRHPRPWDAARRLAADCPAGTGAPCIGAESRASEPR